MLGGAGYVSFFNENVRQGCCKKSFLTQYLRQGWHKKVLFPQNDSQGMYVGNPLELNMLGGAGTKKDVFIENLKQGLYKKVPLTQYVRRDWSEKPLFTENAR